MSAVIIDVLPEPDPDIDEGFPGIPSRQPSIFVPRATGIAEFQQSKLNSSHKPRLKGPRRSSLLLLSATNSHRAQTPESPPPALAQSESSEHLGISTPAPAAILRSPPYQPILHVNFSDVHRSENSSRSQFGFRFQCSGANLSNHRVPVISPARKFLHLPPNQQEKSLKFIRNPNPVRIIEIILYQN